MKTKNIFSKAKDFFSEKFIHNKRNLFIAIAVFLLILFAAIFVPLFVRNSKTVKIAFYQVEEKSQSAIQEQIETMGLPRVHFYTLDPNADLPKNAHKKYSVLFAKKSLATSRVQGNCLFIPKELMEAFPSSIRRSTFDAEKKSNYALPILLDHFEIAFYRTPREKAGLELPKSYGGLLHYLRQIKEYADIPLIVAGAEDKSLFGFISAISESLYGAEGYEKMLSVLQETVSLNKANLPSELTRVLDEVKEMQKQNLIFSQWTNTREKDVAFFTHEHRAAAVGMFLSDHRQMEFNVIKYFDAAVFPRYDLQDEHGVVAPECIAMFFKSFPELKKMQAAFCSNQVQTSLSNKSLLAPTTLRAESVDLQADDVRFWAASCARGPLCAISDAVELYEDRRHILAEKIRSYLNY